jgi:hypothetical protein
MTIAKNSVDTSKKKKAVTENPPNIIMSPIPTVKKIKANPVSIDWTNMEGLKISDSFSGCIGFPMRLPQSCFPPAIERIVQMHPIVPLENVQQCILVIRGVPVMLDRDLAKLYQVKPIALRQQVKRNRQRFPGDFMFQLTDQEVNFLVSHSVIPSRQSLGGYLPYAFTEQGVAMLASVLHSPRAVAVNISIVRAFVQLRETILSNARLMQRIDELEMKFDAQFKLVFKAIRKLVVPFSKRKAHIGFVSVPEEKTKGS